MAEKIDGVSLDMADAKPSIVTAAVVLLIVILGIPFLKFVFQKYQVPGLSELIQAV